jgi:hypothetical protein
MPTSKKSSSSSQSTSLSSSGYRTKINEFDTYLYNFNNVWLVEKTKQINKTFQNLEKLKNKLRKEHKIDQLRTTNQITKNKIIKLKTKLIKLIETLESYSIKKKELKDCIKYYKNKLDGLKDKNIECVYSRKYKQQK